jgi:hypothetical protein
MSERLREHKDTTLRATEVGRDTECPNPLATSRYRLHLREKNDRVEMFGPNTLYDDRA